MPTKWQQQAEERLAAHYCEYDEKKYLHGRRRPEWMCSRCGQKSWLSLWACRTCHKERKCGHDTYVASDGVLSVLEKEHCSATDQNRRYARNPVKSPAYLIRPGAPG